MERWSGVWLAVTAAAIGCSTTTRGGLEVAQDAGSDAQSHDGGRDVAAPPDAPSDAGPIHLDSAAPFDAARDAAASDGAVDAAVVVDAPDSSEPECGCSTFGECCDGCSPIAEGESCSAPVEGTGGDAHCVSGECRGEPCECSSGACCDGCFFRPDSYECASEVVYESQCSSESEACPGYFDVIRESFGNVQCPGDGPDCTGEVVHVRTVASHCYTQENPVFCVEGDAGAACAHTCS